ncbi:MAG: glycosyltransferase [Cyanobacteriota bacterium]
MRVRPQPANVLNVALFGHVSASFGLADGAEATRRSLEASGCRVHCVDLKLTTHQSLADGSAKAKQLAPAPTPAAVLLDLVHTNPNVLAATPGLLDPARLTAPLRIGYWAWELEVFPDGWERQCCDYDEIWCPSAYCAQSLSQRSCVPVVPLPHLPDWPRLDALRQQRRQRQRSDRPFRFLTLFDFWSTPERKNPAGAIAAFQAAFPPDQAATDPPVQLLIKTSSAEQFPRQRRQLESLAGGDPRVRWLDGLLSRDALDALFCGADALVSLHRAEGFGLNLADAMAIELPVIATGYSANLEFMPLGSAELVPWQPTTVSTSCWDYRAGMPWAEPDQQAAAAAMRRLVEQPGWAADLGRRGAAAVRERLATERLAGIVRQRLAQLLLQPSRRQLLAELPPDHHARLLEWSHAVSPR